jgi:hypothetical protein
MIELINLEQRLLKYEDKEYIENLKIAYIEKHSVRGVLDLDAFNKDYQSHLREVLKLYE